MRPVVNFILCALFLTHTVLAEGPHYYTDAELAEKWQGVVHPGEKPRGQAFVDSTKKGGFWIGCAAAISAFANNRLGKVFHNGVIGATFAQWELDPNRPKEVRFGSFADNGPQTLWGIASYTTGRDTAEPNQLMPDVTGLGLAFMHEDKWVPWTSTASRAAFARSGERFARLAGYPAIAKLILGLMSPSGLREAHQGRSENTEQPDNVYRRPPGWFSRLANQLGGMLGEGLFVGLDPVPGVGTLVPAVLSGRRSPFPGFRDVGFGTDTRLLTESVPLTERRAFRLSFALADTETNRQLLAEIPGWLTTLDRGLRGTPVSEIYPDIDDGGTTRLLRGQQLSAQFVKWMSKKNVKVEYDVFMQLDDPTNPSQTPIEASHKGWYSPKIRVATLTLHSYGDRPHLGKALNEFATAMHLPPGAGFHMPVGDLAWYRSVGRLVGMRDRPVTIGETGVVAGAYTQSRDLRRSPNPAAEVAELMALFREAGLSTLP